MGLGILEPTQAVVPGTIQLFDTTDDAVETSHLKHSKDGTTILAPQPSDSPNDPLNWAPLKKDFIFVIILFTAILSGVHGPMLAAATVDLAVEFDTSIAAISQLSSYMTLLVCGVAYFDAAFANVYGKRGIWIVSLTILMCSDIWACKASSYGSLLGARILSGAGQAALECLTPAIIPDLYFVHERTKRIMATLLFGGSGVFLGVVICGQITAAAGWRATFVGLAVSEGIMLVLTFLFMHEPAYKREHVDPLAHMSEQAISEKVEASQVQIHDEEAARMSPVLLVSLLTFLLFP